MRKETANLGNAWVSSGNEWILADVVERVASDETVRKRNERIWTVLRRWLKVAIIPRKQVISYNFW